MKRDYAEKLFIEAANMNPGVWVPHSYNVAYLAETIAERAGMNCDNAYVFGLLHDIGRRNGAMQARHAIEGYRFLAQMGNEAEARICLTHTFQYQNVDGIYDTWDCNEEEKSFVSEYLNSIVYDDYDKLIQLCDALSLTDDYCYAEKKMVNSVLKFGFKDTTLDKWKAILDLKSYFDKKTNGDIYQLFDIARKKQKC